MGKTRKQDQSDDQILRITSELLDLCSQPCQEMVSGLWKEHVRIRKLLANISDLQEKELPELLSRETKLQAFLEWCEKVGVESDGVTIAQFENFGGGLGLLAKQKFPRGSVLVQVPRKAMLSVENAEKSAVFKAAIFKDPILKGMSNVTLSLFTLNERMRREDSFWFPYLSILPSEYTTALYFTETELEALRGSPAFEESLKIFRSIVRQFAYFHQILGSVDRNILSKTLFSVQNFTFDRYKWAVSTTMTRINMIPAAEDPNRKIPALIPFLDFANHRVGPPSTDFYETGNCAICRSATDLSEGDQIFIFYGARNNADFLLHDGFVYSDDLSHDYLSVKLGLSKSDKVLVEKTKILQELFGLQANEVFFVGRPGEIIQPEMVSFVKIFLAEEKVIRKVLEKVSVAALSDDTLQLKALKFLSTRFQLLLRGYNAPENEKNGSPRMVLAKTLVGHEKNMLQNAIEHLNSKISTTYLR